jgi:hypothetical protein
LNISFFFHMPVNRYLRVAALVAHVAATAASGLLDKMLANMFPLRRNTVSASAAASAYQAQTLA